jgi:glucose/arabinose dehydrogenase
MDGIDKIIVLLIRKLILDLPAEPGPYHQVGKLKIGPDENLYAVVEILTQ